MISAANYFKLPTRKLLSCEQNFSALQGLTWGRSQKLYQPRSNMLVFVSTQNNKGCFEDLRTKILTLKARELELLAGQGISISDGGGSSSQKQTKPKNRSTNDEKSNRNKSSQDGKNVKKRKVKKELSPLSNIGANSKSELGQQIPLKNLEQEPPPALPKDEKSGKPTKKGKKPKNDKSTKEAVASVKVKPVKEIKPAREVKASSPDNSHGESLQYKLEQKVPVLTAYFDIYVSSGKVGEAFEDFKELRSNAEASFFVKNIEIYDALLRGFARRKDFARIQELWKDLLASNLEPSLDSYISSILSLSQDQATRNVFKSIFRRIYEEFLSKGFTLDEALRKGRFDFGDKDEFLRCLETLSDIGGTQLPNIPYSNPLITGISNISSTDLVSHLDGVLARKDLDPLAAEQMKNEKNRVVTIPSICREKSEASKKMFSFTAELEDTWRTRLQFCLKKRIAKRKKLPVWLKGQTINMHLFLSCIPLSELTEIILANAKEIVENSETYSPPTSALSYRLGTEVMNAYFLHKKTRLDVDFKENYDKCFSSYLDWYSEPASASPPHSSTNHREAIAAASHNFSLDKSLAVWPGSVRSAVGNELKNIILQEITLTRDRNGEVVVNGKVIGEDGQVKPPPGPLATSPAFFKVFRTRKDNQDNEEVKPHPSLSRLYLANKMLELEFSPSELPMLCPPQPWVSQNTGAFLLRTAPLVRVSEYMVSEQMERIESLPPGALNPILDAVNQLSSVPWKVNLDVLNLAKTVFLNQTDTKLLSALDLPLHPDNIPPPQLQDSLKEVLSSNTRLNEDQMQTYQQYQMNKSLHSQIKGENYSLWCDALYRLSIASHYQARILWFPHNMDFRGRVYPMPPHLNHMGSDLAKALLVFARGKPLGREGLNWLKLHCINLTGLKKRESVASRLEYADEILEDILDSADNPMTGRQWFLESDEPWLTFSAACEIRNALQHPEGPENYICHLPIHQDGSCNGLQHYAALGRDKLGASAVNLVPAPCPQDVYSEIAAIVERKRQEDADSGVEVAGILGGFVKRKVVKQTVMTTVYGVTKYGATKQIARQLKDIGEFPPEHVDLGSKYLATKTFESLNEMFTASQEIQNWLTECSKVIAGDCNSNVEWETPLGFPVVQPYTRYVSNPVKQLILDDKKLLSLGRKLRVREKIKKVNTLKHKNGFPPNFIHSLDSSHMMLTSLHLWSQGITFASVHDCYWTHACDVMSMNSVCREQFIALHSFPILENLSQFFLQKYLHMPIPSSGKGFSPIMIDQKPELHSEQKPEFLSEQKPEFLSEQKSEFLSEQTPEFLSEKESESSKLGSPDEDTESKKPESVTFTLREIELKKREMLFKKVPSKGTLDLELIKNSIYFFS